MTYEPTLAEKDYMFIRRAVQQWRSSQQVELDQADNVLLALERLVRGIITHETCKKIVDGILADLTDRRGFRQALDACDEEIQGEIKAAMITVCRKAAPANADRE